MIGEQAVLFIKNGGEKRQNAHLHLIRVYKDMGVSP